MEDSAQKGNDQAEGLKKGRATSNYRIFDLKTAKRCRTPEDESPATWKKKEEVGERRRKRSLGGEVGKNDAIKEKIVARERE